MRIEIYDTLRIFDNLSMIVKEFSGGEGSERSDEASVNTSQVAVGNMEIPNLASQVAPLGYPLNGVRLIFDVNLYSDYRASIFLLSRGESVFRGLSKNFGRRFKKGNNLAWAATNGNCEGYVVRAEKSDIEQGQNVLSPVVSIGRFYFEGGLGRVLSLGGAGVEPCKLRDYNSFLEDVGVLQNATNSLLSTIYSSNRKPLPNISVVLDCVSF